MNYLIETIQNGTFNSTPYIELLNNTSSSSSSAISPTSTTGSYNPIGENGSSLFGWLLYTLSTSTESKIRTQLKAQIKSILKIQDLILCLEDTQFKPTNIMKTKDHNWMHWAIMGDEVTIAFIGENNPIMINHIKEYLKKIQLQKII